MKTLAVALTLLAMPALAATPRLAPSRDVVVDYTVNPRDHAPLAVQVSVQAGGAHLRITSADLPTALLVDRPAHVATILLPMLKLYATIGMGEYDPQETVLRQARFEPHGRAVVAGYACTNWTAVSPRGRAAACITEDGVILRGTAFDFARRTGRGAGDGAALPVSGAGPVPLAGRIPQCRQPADRRQYRRLRRLPAVRLLAVLLLLPLGARAEAPAALQPLRDVDVTYRVPVPGGSDASLLQRLRWSAAHRMQRVDLPTSGNWMVLDFATQRMSLVRDESREVMDLPAPLNAAQPSAGAAYSRAGTDMVAGLACTEWRTIDTRGQETLACYTDDGVLLQAKSGGRIMMQAVAVKYEAQPEAIFAPPAGYTHQQTSR